MRPLPGPRPPEDDEAGNAQRVPPKEACSAIRVAIVSELRLLRDGLADALGRHRRMQIVSTAADAGTALAQVRNAAPAVLLVDMALPDALAVVRAVSAAANHGPSCQVVAFAVTDCDADLMACVEAGVTGYIAREGTVDDVMAAVESVARGETLCSPRLAASLFRRVAALERERRSGTAPGERSPGGSSGDVESATAAPDDAAALTSREREILSLIERGLANKEIAGHLGIEVATVKHHVHRILEKLRVTRRGQAAARARGGLPHPARP